MKLLVVGDIHGCFHTFKKLVKQHWNPKKEILISVGDLINKGPNSGLCIEYWLRLRQKHPNQTFMVRGNHEQMLIDYFDTGKDYGFIFDLLRNIEGIDLKPLDLFNWVKDLPLKWESAGVLISHAGVSKSIDNPFSIQNPQGVLYNRGPLENIGKLQLVGHNVVDGNKPIFNPKENAWYTDTGAWAKKNLSAVRIDKDGNNPEIIRLERSKKDNS